MEIPKYRNLKESAASRLHQANDGQRIVLIYALIAAAVAALLTGLQFGLDARIAQTSGLRDLGLRSLLSSIGQFLPIVQYMFTLVLEFGYMAAMVRISRGQYTSPKTLKAGVDRFWPLLRLTVLKTLVYMAVAFGSFYLAIAIFMISPFSNPLVELLSPLVSQGSVLSSGSLILDEVTQQAILSAIWPAYLILAIILLVCVTPVFYRYRMADYVLYDHPETGALFALRESRMMLRGKRFSLFRLDLHFWWFYGSMVIVMLVGYADLLLSLLGVTLPISENISFFLFYGISLVFQCLIFYFLRNRVEVTYALAYDALRPKPQDNGVVLGNIFQM